MKNMHYCIVILLTVLIVKTAPVTCGTSCAKELMNAIYKVCGVTRRELLENKFQVGDDQNELQHKIDSSNQLAGGNDRIRDMPPNFFGLSRKRAMLENEYQVGEGENELQQKIDSSNHLADGNDRIRGMPPNFFGLSGQREMRDRLDDSTDKAGFHGVSANALKPASKLLVIHDLDAIKSYLGKSKRSTMMQGSPDGNSPRGKQEINDLMRRGNTAVNMMADLCCKSKCNWRELKSDLYEICT